MVPFNEAEDMIDEFWRLGEAKGGYELLPARDDETQDSASTGHTQSITSPRRRGRAERAGLHLMAVWFDLLLVGGVSLLNCELVVDGWGCHGSGLSLVRSERRPLRGAQGTTGCGRQANTRLREPSPSPVCSSDFNLIERLLLQFLAEYARRADHDRFRPAAGSAYAPPPPSRNHCPTRR